LWFNRFLALLLLTSVYLTLFSLSFPRNSHLTFKKTIVPFNLWFDRFLAFISVYLVLMIFKGFFLFHNWTFIQFDFSIQFPLYFWFLYLCVL
jgi:hypothetical protein